MVEFLHTTDKAKTILYSITNFYSMQRGLFVGRFQPFHKAHLEVIKKVQKKTGELLIVIGSAQEYRTKENPLSADERKEMINEVLKSEKIKNSKIFTLNDINSDDNWVAHVEKHVPKFDAVYSGNPRVVNLFRKAGYRVKEIEMIEGINATKIRENIIAGKEWENLVPDCVRKFLWEKKLVEVIKK